MTKKKSIATKLLIALAALTLISCCFLGSTFARYTSGGSGTATTSVAKWDVSLANAGSLTPTFEDLSPAQERYTPGTPRTNSTGKVKVAALSNTGDVNALVTFTFDATATITYSGGDFASTDEGGENKPDAESDVQGLFSIKLYYSTGEDSAAAATNAMESGKTKVPLAAGSGNVYVYAEVIWKSNDAESDSDQCEAADKLDTWVGENVESISFKISYIAEQNSEKPAGN